MFYGWWKLLTAVLVALASAVIGREDGHLSIWSIFALSALGFMVLVFGAAWYRQSRSIDEWLRAQGAEPVIYEFSEDAVETTSAVGSTKLKWEAFRGLLITEDDMLLSFPRAGALTLPTQQVPTDAIGFAKARLLAHGKKIADKRKTANSEFCGAKADTGLRLNKPGSNGADRWHRVMRFVFPIAAAVA